MLDSNYSELLRILGNSGGDTTIEYDSPYSIALAILEANGVDTSEKHYDSLYSILEEIESMGQTEEKFTFSITTDSANTVVINGEERTSIDVLGGDEITWSVSRTGYVTQTGSWIMRREDKSVNVTLVANQYTFTINTSSDNTVVINGSERTSITADYGTTINWSVSREHYVTQSGSTTLTADTTENITLVLQQFTYTIITDPANRTIINGEVRTTFTGDYGTLISWGVDRTGYVYQSGNFYLTEDTTRTVTLVIEQHTFTIVPTPNDATVTINGSQRTSVTVDYGTAITWSVEKTNYTSQSGSVASLEADQSINVSLVPVNYTITFDVTPNDAVIEVDGSTLSGTTYTGAYGTTISYEISKTDYETVTGTKTITGNETVTVVMQPAVQKNYLAMDVLTPGTITWNASDANNTKTIEYSKNGGEWTSITSSTAGEAINVTTGDEVRFRGTNLIYASSDSSFNNFKGTATYDLKGNIASIMWGDDFETHTTITTGNNYVLSRLFYNNTSIIHSNQFVIPFTSYGSGTISQHILDGMFEGCTNMVNTPSFVNTSITRYGFMKMFKGCTSLTTAPILPATTLERYCYMNMFEGCTSLTTLPSGMLPATTVAQSGYNAMFKGCTGLTTVPTNLLPATTLNNGGNCYQDMFNGCTSLTTAPNLPVTNVSGYGYTRMFQNCSSLTTPPTISATTVGGNAMESMFQGCTSLATLPNLPATTLASNCYYNMFSGCTSITSIPNNYLPATTLQQYCYASMFYGCTGLTTVPTNLLPATTLQQRCYQSMFANCTSLATLPNLPATTLAGGCYLTMFHNCAGITSIPNNYLPATTLVLGCYQNMFSGCNYLTSVPSDLLPATTLVDECYRGMFDGCLRLATAPNLPATTLVYRCYYQMFKGCSNLNSVTCLATDISASQCVEDWLLNTAASGTLYKDPNMTDWVVGTNVPSGWTIADAA